MRARIIPLYPHGDETMTCPDNDTLTLFASLGEDLHEAEELLAPWQPESLVAHIKDCPTCKHTVEDWRSSLEQWKSVDLVEKSLFGDGYFDKLQKEVESKIWSDAKELIRPEVITLAEHRSPRGLTGRPLVVAYAAAALLLLGLGFALLGGGASSITPPTPLAANSSDSTELPAAPDVDSLEAQGRALGRSLLASLTVDDSEGELADGNVWGVSTLLGSTEDELEYLYRSGYGSPLDDLSDAEADALIQQL